MPESHRVCSGGPRASMNASPWGISGGLRCSMVERHIRRGWLTRSAFRKMKLVLKRRRTGGRWQVGLVRPRGKVCTTACPLCPLSQLCYLSLQGCEVKISGEQDGPTHSPPFMIMNVTGPREMSLLLGFILFFPPIHPSPQSSPPCPVRTYSVPFQSTFPILLIFQLLVSF